MVLRGSGITGLLEAHGTYEDSKLALHEFTHSHNIYIDPCESVGAGGLITMWDRSFFS